MVRLWPIAASAAILAMPKSSTLGISPCAGAVQEHVRGLDVAMHDAGACASASAAHTGIRICGRAARRAAGRAPRAPARGSGPRAAPSPGRRRPPALTPKSSTATAFGCRTRQAEMPSRRKRARPRHRWRRSSPGPSPPRRASAPGGAAEDGAEAAGCRSATRSGSVPPSTVPGTACAGVRGSITAGGLDAQRLRRAQLGSGCARAPPG